MAQNPRVLRHELGPPSAAQNLSGSLQRASPASMLPAITHDGKLRTTLWDQNIAERYHPNPQLPIPCRPTAVDQSAHATIIPVAPVRLRAASDGRLSNGGLAASIRSRNDKPPRPILPKMWIP